MKLQLIWDLDGTLIDSQPEIIATLGKALERMGISVSDATSPLRIGPPLPDMLRVSFPETILSEDKRNEVVRAFRQIYNSSDFENTKPFAGIGDIIFDDSYIHHIITNKPSAATYRIIEKKGWDSRFTEVLTPDLLWKSTGRQMKKVEMFQYFRNKYPEANLVAIGDMATDAQCAKAIGIPAIGVLWGAGTKDELMQAECEVIAGSAGELKVFLKKYN